MNDASPIACRRDAASSTGDAVADGPRAARRSISPSASGAGAVIALQIDIMRVFSVGSWAHFGSLVVSLAMLGFGLTSAVMTRRQGLVRAQLAQRRHRRARPVRSARRRRQPLRPAARLQRHLPRLRPGAEVEASADVPRRADAVPGGRGVPRLRLPQEQPHVRAGLFRRSRRLGALRPRLPGGDVRLRSRQPDRRAARAVARGLPRLGARPRRERARSFPMPGRSCSPSAATSLLAPAFGLKTLAVNDYKGVSYARKFPDSKRVYESASPFGYLEVYSSSYLHFAPGLSDNAGFSLPTMPANAYLGMYIDSDGPIGDHARPDRQGDGLFPLPADGLSLRHQVDAQDLHHPVRRRHLDRGGAALRGEGRHGRRRQSGGARRVQEPGHPRLHRRHSLQGARDPLRGPPFPGEHAGAIRRHRPEPRRFGRALQSGRLRDRREVPLHEGGDGDLHARARAGRRAVGDPLEQGRAAEVGAQALRHDGRRRRARSTPSISPIRSSSSPPTCRPRRSSTRTAASRRRRSPSCASTRAPCRSTRSILRASLSTAPRPTRRSTAMSSRFSRGAAGGPPAPGDGAHGRDGRFLRRRRAARRARPTTACCRRP